MNDDFRMTRIRYDVAPDFHTLPLQGFQVAELAFVRRED